MPAFGQRNLELRDVLIRKNCNIMYTVGFMRLLVVLCNGFKFKTPFVLFGENCVLLSSRV